MIVTVPLPPLLFAGSCTVPALALVTTRWRRTTPIELEPVQNVFTVERGQLFRISKFAKQIYKPIMNDAAKRSVLRWIHILFGLPIIGYIYGPPEEVQQYAPVFRFVFVPVIVLSGFWMWKGHVLRRFVSKKSD